MYKFCIQRDFLNTREAKAIVYTCLLDNRFSFVYNDSILKDHVPVGSVEFCSQYLSKFNINFYPRFLHKYLTRHIYRVNIGNKDKDKYIGYFVKSATKYKSEFKSKILTQQDNVIDDEYYVSSPVSFTQEWRYYVYAGKIITSGWYDGNDEEEPAPKLNINWPANFCGAVDFGRVDGRMQLVESHEPFACGWYGESSDNCKYTLWQYCSWQMLYNKTKEVNLWNL